MKKSPKNQRWTTFLLFDNLNCKTYNFNMKYQEKAQFGRERAFTSGNIWRQMLGYLLPVMMGSLVQQLYSTVDSIIVGQYLGVAALAAVGGSTSTVTTLLVNFFVGLSAGAAVVVAQDFGAEDRKKRDQSVQSALLLGLLAGLCMMAIGQAISGRLLHWMQVPEAVYPQAIAYLRIYMLGMVPIALYNMGASILNAVGDSRSSFLFLASACIANILLDLLFVGVLNLGIAGAAGATCIAQTFSAALILLSLKRRNILVFRAWRFHGATLGRILKIGMPGGLQSGLYSIANMVVQWAINQFPLSYVAAVSAYERIESLFWTLMMALGVAVTTFAGQNYGAGRLDRMRKSVRVAMVLGFSTAVLIAAACMVFADPICGLFTRDAATIQDTRALIFLLMPFCATYVATEVLGGAIKGCGEATVPMIITLLCTCGVRIAWVLIYSRMPAPDIRWFLACYPVSWSVSSLAFAVYYLRGRWLKAS